MKTYKELDGIGKKARTSGGRINCEKCPSYRKGSICNLIETCTYIFETGFRRGYNTRKREQQKSK